MAKYLQVSLKCFNCLWLCDETANVRLVGVKMPPQKKSRVSECPLERTSVSQLLLTQHQQERSASSLRLMVSDKVEERNGAEVP